MTIKTLSGFKALKLDKISLYGQKRFYRSIICALIAALLMQDETYGLALYPLATMFWDWWFFSYRGFKESAQVTEAFLEWKRMTRDQIDQYVMVTMYAKRVLLVIAVIWTYIDSFKGGRIISIDLFVNHIFLMTLFMGPVLCFKVLRTPYITFVWGSNSDFTLPSLSERQFWDPCDPNNPAGYYNPASINYRFK